MLNAPTIVRVDDFRAADEGDTARLEVYGVPPAHPLPVAPDAPRLGEPVTSIGFPGLNIADTDGIDLDALLAGSKSPAEVLQDSRLQPANTSGTIIARQYRHGVAVYQVSADFDHGMSGGPTLNNRGQVLGINSQMTIPFLGQNFNIITDTATLRRYLAHDTSDHQPQSAPVNATTPNLTHRPDEVPTDWIALAAVLAAAGVGSAALWWAKRRRTSSATDAETYDRSATTNSSATSESGEAT